MDMISKMTMTLKYMSETLNNWSTSHYNVMRTDPDNNKVRSILSRNINMCFLPGTTVSVTSLEAHIFIKTQLKVCKWISRFNSYFHPGPVFL